MTTQDKNLLERFSGIITRYRKLIAGGTPYVWLLRLSRNDYDVLESLIQESVNSHRSDWRHLLEGDFALLSIIYIGEWYRRVYTGSEKPIINFSTDDRKAIWAASGIDVNTFVYTTTDNAVEKGQHRWDESMKILGGLPVHKAMSQGEDSELLKDLCRLFNDEDVDIDYMEDGYQAIAYRKSLHNRHSLYKFIETLVEGEKYPFAETDLEIQDSEPGRFISTLRTAYSEIRRKKFDLEWIVSYKSTAKEMMRTLKIKLKPEDKTGNRQYIGYDRMRVVWGISNPEDISRLSISLRFRNETSVVKEASFAEPLLIFSNTGCEEAGFVCIDNVDSVMFSNVPSESFSCVELVLKYGDDKIKTIQKFDFPGYMQLYKLNRQPNKWSSKVQRQASTMAIYSSRFHIRRGSDGSNVTEAKFKGRNGKMSEPFFLCPISEILILSDEYGNDAATFYNRTGYYQIFIKQYLNTIQYKESLYVTYKYKPADEEDQDDYPDEDLKVLFGRDGLKILHYQDKNATNAKEIKDYILSYKAIGESQYTVWDDKHTPKQGKLRLNIYVKGQILSCKVFYVPFVASDSNPDPIVRDFQDNTIKVLGNTATIDTSSSDTETVVFDSENGKIYVEVYRPVLIKELYQCDKLIKVYNPDETIELPMVVAEQFKIHDFNQTGVRWIEGKDFADNYFHFPNFHSPDPSKELFSASVKLSKIANIENADFVNMYLCKHHVEDADQYLWDYIKAPIHFNGSNEDAIEDGIRFQSLKEVKQPRHYQIRHIVDSSGWGWGVAELPNDYDYAECFETITVHGAYYFLFSPMYKTINERLQIERIFIPLLKKYNCQLPEQTKKSLRRFARQFHFEWLLQPREAWLNAMGSIGLSPEDFERFKTAITDFFQDTASVLSENDKLSLELFLKRYWEFCEIPDNINHISKQALKLILGKPWSEVRSRNQDENEFLREFDESRFVFSDFRQVL